MRTLVLIVLPFCLCGTGAQARDLFIKHHPVVSDLRQIWELSDRDQDERLNLEEFSIAIFLIQGEH